MLDGRGGQRAVLKCSDRLHRLLSVVYRLYWLPSGTFEL